MKRLLLAALFCLLVGPASAQLSGGLMFPGPGSGSGAGCVQLGNDGFTNVLLHFDGANASTTFTDTGVGTGAPHTFSVTSPAQLDTSQKEFGTASGKFDGTSGYIQTPSGTSLNLGTTWTIDFWVRFNALTANSTPVSRISSAGGTPGWYISINASAKLTWISNANSVLITSTATILSATWTHVAIVTASGTTTMYINGTSSGTTATAQTDTAVPLVLGAIFSTGGNYFNGWIDEFRLSPGVARWTTNFTPPTAPYCP